MIGKIRITSEGPEPNDPTLPTQTQAENDPDLGGPCEECSELYSHDPTCTRRARGGMRRRELPHPTPGGLSQALERGTVHMEPGLDDQGHITEVSVVPGPPPDTGRDYINLLEAMLSNAKLATELDSHSMHYAAASNQELDRAWYSWLARARETFWADLGMPISTCTLCGQPMTTEHNRMPPEEHEKARITKMPRSGRRPISQRGRA